MNPSVAERKLGRFLAAGVAGLVIVALLVLPYASGYALGRVPLWQLLVAIWGASDEWKHGMFVFPIAAVLLFLKRKELAVPISPLGLWRIQRGSIWRPDSLSTSRR